MSSMNNTKIISILLGATVIAVVTQAAKAQETPAEYQQVLKIVGKTGDYKSDVVKINVPRNDLHVKIAGYAVPTPFGFGGWFAMTKGDGGEEVMMGDLVLTQDEVNPVMSALLEHGLEVTALHNHFFWEDPRVFFMHIHGHDTAVAGDVAMLETGVTPTLKALRSHGLDVVAIHHHMINSRPVIIFLHYWGRGPAEKLATGFKAGLDELGKGNK